MKNKPCYFSGLDLYFRIFRCYDLSTVRAGPERLKEVRNDSFHRRMVETVDGKSSEISL
jgi:hypothetical protein